MTEEIKITRPDIIPFTFDKKSNVKWLSLDEALETWPKTDQETK